MTDKIKKFFIHPQIQIALAVGIGIIAQALVYKKIYHIEVEGLFIALPGLVAVLYEVLVSKKENQGKKFLKTIYWIIGITVANIITILIPLFN